MKTAPFPEQFEPVPPFAPGDRLADILAVLTARMSAAQRHAFQAKMSDLDRQRAALSPFSTTLGSA